MPELDPVTQRFIADTTEFVTAVDAATEAVARLADSCATAAEAVDLLQSAIDDLHGKDIHIGVDVAGGDVAATMSAAAAAMSEVTAATDNLTRAAGEQARATYEETLANDQLIRASLDAAAAAEVQAAAERDAANASQDVAARVAAAADTIRRFGDYQRGTVAASNAAETAITRDAAATTILSYARYQAVAAAAAETRANIEQTASMAEVADTVARAAETIRNYTQINHLAASEAIKTAIEEAYLADRVSFAGRTMSAAGKAAADSAAAASAARGPWFLFGNTWATVIHWVLAGSAELLAVVIPALIALGAGALVAAQGAQNVQRHMVALWTAAEATGPALHTTMGDVLGLGHALQSAQDAANPGVYEILGSVINDAKTRFADFAQTGLDVVHMLDEFSARITVDLKGTAGTQLHDFLAGMTTDLQGLGQVLGNFGHALLNVFSAMPGLVHVLLAVVDGISRFVLVLSQAPPVLITFAMAIEEVFRWGGLLLGLFARMIGAGALFAEFAAGGGFLTRFGAAIKAIVVQGGEFIMWVGEAVVGLGAVAPAAEAAGQGMIAFGADVAAAGEEMSTNWVVLLAAATAALLFFIARLASAKTATEQWVAASDQAVAKASDLQKLPTIYDQLAKTTIRLASAQGELAFQVNGVSSRLDAQSGFTRVASQNAVDLANHMISLVNTANTVRSNINYLAGAFHVSAAGAVALANAAGVNLQQGLLKGTMAGQIAVQMINNLKAGLGAMSAPIGVIGADMEALGVQSQLAASKVQQVNQALDQFVAGATGGMQAVAQFNQALGSMASDATATDANLSGAISSIKRTSSATSAMTYTLKGMGPAAQQSWQQFAGAVQQGNAVLDVFRTGMAEGVVSAGQYDTAIRDVVAQLLPFTQGNAAAVAQVSMLAQQAGGPYTTSMKTLAQWAGIAGSKAQNQLAVGMEQAAIKMSNLNLVARNLSATVATQLDSSMAGAIVKASGLDQAYLKWATDVKNNKGPQTLARDLTNIKNLQGFVTAAEQKATGVLNNNTKAALGSAAAVAKATTSTGQLATSVGAATAKIAQHITAVDKAAGSSTTMASKVAMLSQNTATLGGKVSTASGNIQNQARQADTAATATQRLATNTQTAGNNANTASGKMSGLSGNIARVGSAAGAAAGQVATLAAAINNLHDKTVTVTVNTVNTSSGHMWAPGHAQGTPSASRGLALVGEQGPELVAFGGGERVYNAPQTSHILAALTAAQAAGSGGSFGEIHVHSHAYLDSKEVFTSVQRQSFSYQTMNSGARTGLLVPGNKIGSFAG